jgi:hypothetical protein
MGRLEQVANAFFFRFDQAELFQASPFFYCFNFWLSDTGIIGIFKALPFQKKQGQRSDINAKSF